MAQPTSGYRGDILVADDTPVNLTLVANVLRGKGYRVRAVPSGALALKAAEAEVPDLVMLDIMMPGMDGFEVCRRLKENERLRGVPVIFLSALSETLDKVKAFSVGGVDYVTKPFQVEELEARVGTHITLRRLQRQLESRSLDLQESYARLLNLEEVRRKLTQMIVHDLRSPITAALHNAAFVRTEGGLQGELALAIEDVLKSFRVLNRMTLDMLDVAASEQRALPLRLERLSLRGLFDEAVAGVRGSARKVQDEILVDVAEELTVMADRELLRRVVENILDNAFKYAPAASELRIEASLTGDGQYAIKIRDQGPGIPSADRERIFEPYARLDRDSSQHARASRGLGLAFCRLAVEAHRGRIWVEDNEPAGCTFVLKLPVDPPSSAAPAAPAPERAPPRTASGGAT
jgi:signal transduction histidine kinase